MRLRSIENNTNNAQDGTNTDTDTSQHCVLLFWIDIIDSKLMIMYVTRWWWFYCRCFYCSSSSTGPSNSSSLMFPLIPSVSITTCWFDFVTAPDNNIIMVLFLFPFIFKSNWSSFDYRMGWVVLLLLLRYCSFYVFVL